MIFFSHHIIFFIPSKYSIVVVQSLSHFWLFVTLWTAARQASLPLYHLLEFAELMSSPTISSPVVRFSSCLQSFPTSGSFSMSRLFASGGQKYWSFSISPSNEYSGFISFRINWFDLLAVQGTLKSLLRHHSLKTWILQQSSVYDYWKNHSLD